MKEWFQNLIDEFVLNFIDDNRWEWMVQGLKNTLLITLFATLIGIVIGIIIAIVRSTYDKNLETMKKNKLFCALFVIASMLIFNSCNTDVNIYNEGEETTVVYGYLDVDADTNYLKITKSFVGDVIENGQNYNMSNYSSIIKKTLINLMNK